MQWGGLRGLSGPDDGRNGVDQMPERLKKTQAKVAASCKARGKRPRMAKEGESTDAACERLGYAVANVKRRRGEGEAALGSKHN